MNMKRMGIVAAVVLSLGVLGIGIGFGLSIGSTFHSSTQPALKLESEARAQTPQPARSQPAIQLPSYASPRHTIVVDVAQAVSPAVVSIGVTKTTYVRQYDPFGGDLFFTPYMIAPLKQNFPYLGSGFLIDDKGHVVTNYHVVEDSNSIAVTLTDRRTFNARLLDADRFLDVALLQIEDIGPDDNLPFVKMGNSDDIMIGETVLAVGNPFGPLIADPRPSVSVGVVSAVNRSFQNIAEERLYQDMIQSDAAINPGNSGGPLVNLDREVIGINTFIFSRSGDSSSVGFSIPINRVMRVIDEILHFGKVRAIRKDFEYLSLSPYLIQALDLRVEKGALVKSIEIGGPAERAGLKPGDVIISAAGQEIKSAQDLLAQILSRQVGDEVAMRVARFDERFEITYKIEEAQN